MQLPERVEQHKLTDTEALSGYREILEIMQPDVEHKIRIDVSELEPRDVAKLIVDAVGRISRTVD